MASNKDIHAWNPIPCTNRYTAFDTDKFTIHELHKGNPVYSEMMNQRHTNMVFYDKSQPYPTQPDQDYISLTGTKKAKDMQTGILLDNPTTYMAYMDSSHFTHCGGYYFLAFYDQALYHKARLVARFSEKDKPVHEGWIPKFSHVVNDRFLVRVFVSNKQNEETGRKDVKLCVYYLEDLAKKHNIGPMYWTEREPITTSTLLITMPISYAKSAYYYTSIPSWKWIACNNSLYCMQNGQITAYILELVTNETVQITTHTVYDTNIHSECEMSGSDDGCKLFICNKHNQHTHDIYGEECGDSDDVGCTTWTKTDLVFSLPELDQDELRRDTNWIHHDIASLDKTSTGTYTLTFHNPTNGRRVSIDTPYTDVTGVTVHYAHTNGLRGRHYLIIGACSSRYASYVYTMDERDNAIYTYQLPPNIPSNMLTRYDVSVFGDGLLMIGGFRRPMSMFSGETSVTYEVKPTLFIDTLAQAPIPDELIRIAMSYL